MHTPAPGQPTPVLESSDPQMSSNLIGKLESTRQGMKRFRRTRSLLRGLLIVLAAAGALAAADWLWVLGMPVRAAGLLGLAVLAGVLLYRGLAGARLFGRQEAAEEVEAAFPELGQRVRTTLQYSESSPDRAPALPELVIALASDTSRRTTGVDFASLIPWTSLRVLVAGLVGLAMLFAVLLCSKEEVRTAALRLFLLHVQYTRLEVKPGNHTLKVGSDLDVEAIVTGRPVAKVELHHRPAGSGEAWTECALDLPNGPSRLVGHFATTLKGCGKDLEYRIVAGPVESPVYRLTIVHPLVVKQFEATIQPPAYTRRPAATVKEKDFKVIAGSAVRFHIALDRAPATAKLLLFPVAGAKGPAQGLPPVPLEVRDNVLTASLASVEKELEYEIVAEASDGMRLEPARFPIQVLPDRKPTVRFVKPKEQIEVTPSTEVRMKIEAADDFGLSKVGIIYQVGNGAKKALYLQNDPKQPLSAQILAKLPLEDHALSFQDSVTYFAFAEDNHPTRPQRTTTELQFIDIRPYKRAYQSIEGGGCCNGKSVSLEELISRQRDNLRRTFIQSERAEVDPRACGRLAKAQRELAEVTAEFTAGLKQRFGPVSCLHEAEEAMNAAATALQQNEAKKGGAFEETALARLIKARKNLRQLLSDSKCASQCRKFDTQQQQRLRKPPRKGNKDELARLQEEIEKLGKEERKLSQEMASASAGAKSSGSSSGKDRPSSARGKDSVGQRQEKAAQKASELQKRVGKDEALTELARERMAAAAEAARASAKSMQEGKQGQASQQAGQAAEMLERLGRQVAGLKAADLTARLAHTQGMARQLSRQQQKLEKELEGMGGRAGRKEQGTKQAGGQRGAAEEARTLADLIDRLQGDAAEKNPHLGEALRQASEASSPSTIERQMRKAAEALQAGKPGRARRDVQQAARGLEALAQKLEAAHRGLVGPQLARLLAAEKKAAEAQRALDSVNNDQQKAAAQKKVADLRETMEPLAAGDARIARAAEALAESVRRPGGWSQREVPHDPRLGAYVPPIEYADSVQKVVKVLQVRIQEIILKDALLDRDEAVPPQYKALVEEYYRALADDLR
jgi:hypothetical protein